ncbi:hypothetical protein EXN51_15375 [Agrobacterium fabrum]|uniref:Uncharacterized protein n=1 Tax=Agrobacterium fabrum (strain C58 / ATCC 33970) TaxID=176299 RepID=A8WFI1_AGRFC|nr:hypothetical protein Atu8059 [Agrobacterium fabrum str. C58]TRB28050.1 hypothetical protein EXN51_15375 [Agrobacterium fabrum]
MKPDNAPGDCACLLSLDGRDEHLILRFPGRKVALERFVRCWALNEFTGKSLLATRYAMRLYAIDFHGLDLVERQVRLTKVARFGKLGPPHHCARCPRAADN